jgi:hypothetical protein
LEVARGDLAKSYISIEEHQDRSLGQLQLLDWIKVTPYQIIQQRL